MVHDDDAARRLGTDSRLKIVSSPSLMVIDNQKAQIQVGKKVPTLPSTQSVADTRTHTGRSAGNAARTASNTSSGKRMRWARLPP